MFKKILVGIVILVFLVHAKTITKNYSYTETPQVINGRVHLQGCHLRYTHFAPSVVEQPVVIYLGKGEKAVSVSVEYNGETFLADRCDLKPITPGIRIGSPKPDRSFYEQKSEVYDKNEFYPAQNRSQWFNTQYKNGHAIVYSSVNPVQYNPQTQQIRYYTDIKVTVRTEQETNSPYYLCTPSIKSDIEAMVHNPEAVADLTYTKQGEEDYEYLIITPDALKDAWTKMIDFNAKRGLRTKIEVVQNINANGTGDDIQQKIRNYIKQEYEQSNITYVLMGSDDNPSDQFDCASRLFGCKFYDHDQSSTSKLHEESDIGAEMYYETLDGEWINDDDPYYGAPGSQDLTWEVFSGRFPADNASDVSTMIDKTVAYSTTPVKEEITNLALGGNYAWTNNGVTVWGGDALDEHVGVSENNGYKTYGFPADKWTVAKFYEKDNGGEGSMTAAKIRKHLQDNKSAFFIHEGHGNISYVWSESTSGVTTTNYPQNGADKGNYFIAMSGACYPSNFNENQDCILEAFAKLPTGIVASISNDKTGWGDDDGTDGSTHRVYRNVIDGLFNEEYQMHQLGRMHARGKEAVADIVLNSDLDTAPYFYCITYCIYETILMGDPALSVWTDTPKDLTPTIPDVSAAYFEWDSKLPHTWVALVNESDEIIAAQLTGKDGKCKIEADHVKTYIAANAGKDLTVRVKAHNYYMYEGTVKITGTNIKNDALNNVTINRLTVNSHNLKITYTLNTREQVTVSIFNSKGLLIKTLVNGSREKGIHSATFNSSTFGNGVYYCKIKSGDLNSARKFVIAH